MFKGSAPSSDVEGALINFGSQAVMTFWVLDPWLCVADFHRICFSSEFAAGVQDNSLVPLRHAQARSGSTCWRFLKAARLSWPCSGFRPFGFAPPAFAGFAFQRQPGCLDQLPDFRPLALRRQFSLGLLLSRH